MPPKGRRAGSVQGVDVRRGPVEDDAPVRLDDERNISIQVGTMEAVSQHEHVVDLRSHVANGERHDAPCGPVQQRAHIEGPGRALPDVRQEVREGQAGVDQVLDEHDVATLDVDVEVLEDPYATGVRGVSGDGEEVDRDVDVGDGAHKVREEDQRPLQHADEHDAVGVIAGDLTGDPLDVRADGALVDEDGRRRLSTALRRSGHSPSESCTAWTSNAARNARPNRESDASSCCALARASGFRWRRYWNITCLNSSASRSAKCLYMRRWRAPIPCA